MCDVGGDAALIDVHLSLSLSAPLLLLCFSLLTYDGGSLLSYGVILD